MSSKLQQLAELYEKLEASGQHEEAAHIFAQMLPLMPPELQDRIHNKAVELGLMPEKPHGYTDDGERMYRLEDIAQRAGLTLEEAEESIARFNRLPPQFGVIHTVQ